MAQHFTDPDVWHGGAVDLVILAGSRAQLAPEAADERIDSVLRAVWAAPGLTGPYSRRDVAPELQSPAAPTLRGEREHGLYGVTQLNAGLTACATQVVRDDPGDSDWVYVDLPLGGLDRLSLHVDGPDADADALRQVRDFLLGVARAVYDQTQFAAAGIGHELQGPDVADFMAGRASRGGADWLVSTPRGLKLTRQA
jgi:hypothetical protein